MPHPSRLIKPLGAALAVILAMPVLGALLRPLCVALQADIPWVEPVALAHGFGALLLAGAFWMLGLSPLAGLRQGAATARGRSVLDASNTRLFLLFGLLPLLITAIGFSKAMALGLPLSPRPLFWLATALIVGLAEEYAVRGPLFELLAKFGPRSAIYGTAIFFALLHVGNFRGAPDALVVAGQIFGALVTGLCWSFMRWRCRTIWPAAAIHGFGDFVTFLLADGLTRAVQLDPSPHAHAMQLAIGFVVPLAAAGFVWLLGQARPVGAPVTG